jgi:hypothetical protein
MNEAETRAELIDPKLKAYVEELETEKSRRDGKNIENKINPSQPNPEGVK